MQFTLAWEAITAVIAVLSFFCAAVGLYVRMAVRSALAEFRNDLLTAINSQYVRQAECALRHPEQIGAD